MSKDDPLGLLGGKSPIEGLAFNQFVGKGNHGFVYKVTKGEKRIPLACKIMRKKDLKVGWEREVDAALGLMGVRSVIQYNDSKEFSFNGFDYVCILSEFVDGQNLEEYVNSNPQKITLSFVESILRQCLGTFYAMQFEKIAHRDLHARNIMIANPDPREYQSGPSVKIGDFGIGNSVNGLAPKDDYEQLCRIIGDLLRHVDDSQLSGENKFFYDRLTSDFLRKRLAESDPTVGDWVKSPEKLLEILDQIRKDFAQSQRRTDKLMNPFDYLNCEQIGDSFKLLQSLYSSSFPGYSDLLQKTNTILTGPRGCGKTTILRNLSMKTLLGAKQVELRGKLEHIGLFFHCFDLFLAFPYLREKADLNEQRAVSQFFSLSIFYELLETLDLAQRMLPEGAISEQNTIEIQKMLKSFMPHYVLAPVPSNAFGNMMEFIQSEKQAVRDWVALGTEKPKALLPLDFIHSTTRSIRKLVNWMDEVPIFVLLDDYSLPKIPEVMQRTLNDIIFQRTPDVFFKVSTESTTTFVPLDSSNKLVEETREFDTINLGTYFLDASAQAKRKFLKEVIENRFDNSEQVPKDYNSIEKLLGKLGCSYNDLALKIRTKSSSVDYHGWDLLCDSCSGDIAKILQIVRDILASQGSDIFSRPKKELPIKPADQDKMIRRNGISFLNTIEAAPKTGPTMRRVANAFGHVALDILKTRDSKNGARHPPWQAFRIEPYEDFRLTLDTELQEVYDDLIKYGVFISDTRGKSIRGVVVPRLYLRRILIPTFLLTPSKRDSVKVESEDFELLLTNAEEFEKVMQKKKERMGIEAIEVDQERLED